ncbi:MAG: alpha/beta hydrolase [Candidatus Kaiserbacteria bacterium]|nr:alpha/beta hydrolase [Candidatus Kaiserbacteria bacterium]
MQCIVNGLATNYEERGSGEAVIMLHGWKDDLHTFDGIASVLGENFRIVRLDLPGFGGSEAPKGDWILDDYAGFVKDFLGKLSISPDTLIGHSFGGRIAIKGIAANKFSAKKIILISSAGVARRKTFRNMLLAVLAKVGRVITAIPPISFWKQEIRRGLYRSIGSDYFQAGALGGTFLNIIKEDLSSSAKNIMLPTLIIWGSKDSTTPISEGRRLNQLISGSTLRVIEGAGHFVHKERPKEVSELIRKFQI